MCYKEFEKEKNVTQKRKKEKKKKRNSECTACN